MQQEQATTAKAIPGPYKARPSLAGWWRVVVAHSAVESETVAQVPYQYDADVTEATARLLAAAPLMHSAIDLALMDLYVARDGKADPSAWLHSAIDKLEAAIAAARGVQP